MALTQRYTSCIVFNFISDDVFTYNLLLGDVPSTWESNSTAYLFGQIEVIENSANIDITTIDFEIHFDFGVTPIQVVNPDVNGFFSVVLQSRTLLSEETGFFRLRDSITNLFNFEQPLTAVLIEPLNISVIGTLIAGSFFSISGNNPNGNDVTISTTNSTLLSPEVLTLNNFNQYFKVVQADYLAPSQNDVVFQVEDTVNLQTATDTKDFINTGFTPSFQPAQPDNLNITVTCANVGTVPANIDIAIKVYIGATIFLQDSKTSNNSGSFTFTYAVPDDFEGQTLFCDFTYIDTGQVVTDSRVLPNITPLSMPELEGQVVYTRKDPRSFVVTGTSGREVTVSITAPSTAQYFLDGITSVSNANQFLISLPLEHNEELGVYAIELTAGNHITYNTTFELRRGLEGELTTPAGLRFQTFKPDDFDKHSQTFWSRTGTQINGTLFGNAKTYTITSGNQVDIIETIPNTTGFGFFDVIWSSPDSDETVELTYRVDDEGDYVFSYTSVSPIYTNNSDVTQKWVGILLPWKTGSLDVTVFGISETINPDSFANWEVTRPSLAWAPRGDYTIELTATGETTINETLNHRPDLTFSTPPVSLSVQGDPSVPFEVRGDINEVINVDIPGVTAALQETTNGSGYANFAIPPIPLNFNTPVATTINASAVSDPVAFVSQSFSVDPRVPITIDITNAPSVVGLQDVLFVDSVYNVEGDAPSNGILSLTAIGEYASFILDTFNADTYTATLTTNASIGDIKLTVSTDNQPSVSKTYTVISVVTVTTNEPFFASTRNNTVDLDGDPNLQVTIEVELLDASDLLYESFQLSTTLNSSGLASVNIPGTEMDRFGTAKVTAFSSPGVESQIDVSVVFGSGSVGDIIAYYNWTLGRIRINNSLPNLATNISDSFQIARINDASANDGSLYAIDNKYVSIVDISIMSQNQFFAPVADLIGTAGQTIITDYDVNTINSSTTSPRFSLNFYINDTTVENQSASIRFRFLGGVIDSFSIAHTGYTWAAHPQTTFTQSTFVSLGVVFRRNDVSFSNNNTLYLYFNGILVCVFENTSSQLAYMYRFTYNLSGNIQAAIMHRTILDTSEIVGSLFATTKELLPFRAATVEDIGRYMAKAFFPVSSLSHIGYGYFNQPTVSPQLAFRSRLWAKATLSGIVDPPVVDDYWEIRATSSHGVVGETDNNGQITSFRFFKLQRIAPFTGIQTIINQRTDMGLHLMFEGEDKIHIKFNFSSGGLQQRTFTYPSSFNSDIMYIGIQFIGGASVIDHNDCEIWINTTKLVADPVHSVPSSTISPTFFPVIGSNGSPGAYGGNGYFANMNFYWMLPFFDQLRTARFPFAISPVPYDEQHKATEFNKVLAWVVWMTGDKQLLQAVDPTYTPLVGGDGTFKL